MSDKTTPVGGDLTMKLVKAAAQGAPMPNTSGHDTARILAMTMMARGAEKIDPNSLTSGKQPKLFPCATIDLNLQTI